MILFSHMEQSCVARVLSPSRPQSKNMHQWKSRLELNYLAQLWKEHVSIEHASINALN